LPKANGLGAIFVGIARSESPSLHAILEELPSEDNSASSDGESSGFPIPRECNAVTSVIPIATTPLPEETLMLQTILVVSQQNTVHQPDTELLPSDRWPTRRNDGVLCRTASNAGPCNDGAKLMASERPLRSGWLTYTNVSLRSGWIGPR
jgi:hypothetical protein